MRTPQKNLTIFSSILYPGDSLNIHNRFYLSNKSGEQLLSLQTAIAMPKQQTQHSISQLIDEGKKYFLLQFEYARLTVTEKISLILGMMFLSLIVFVLAVGGSIYLSFALVYLLEPLLGIAASYALVGALFFLLAGAALLFKKAIILNPITRFISRVLLNDNDAE